MKENKKMSSIARKINIRFWFDTFFNMLCIDILIIVIAAGMFVYWRYEQLPAGVNQNGFYLNYESGQRKTEYVIEGSDGNRYSYDLSSTIEYLKVPVIFFLSCELLILLFSVFRTNIIRRKMKPLNDLAVKAEQISKAPFDLSKMESLEQAITHISPDEADIGIHTGDKDLQSIEIALNNLLKSMKENEKRQVRFVSDASHELRTPIAVIQGYVNMLDRWGKKDEEVLTESIEALKNESQHMKELIEQLLFLARGDSGRNTLNMAVLDLNRIVNEVWEESMMIDETHNYMFSGTDEACIFGDAAMIKQSVRIFVQNAAKYSREGADITFAVKKESGFVFYIIQDEGIGMEADEVIHIFDRFYRSDEARNSSTGGSGLGLSIAKWIVDAHQGTIQVISRPDIGTRFIVRFPEKIQRS